MRALSVSLVGILCAAILAASGQASGSMVEPTLAADTVYDDDIGIVNFKPWDTCYVGDTWRTRPMMVTNFGRHFEAFDVLMILYSGDSTPVYVFRTSVMLVCGETASVSPPAPFSRIFDRPGNYVVFTCTTELAGDENPANDGGSERMVVLPRPGLMEDKTDSSIVNQPGLLRASVMDVALFRSLILNTRSRVRVLDCTGRTVAPERACQGVHLLIADRPRKIVVK